MRCPTCGEEITSSVNGKYRCNYCGEEIVEETKAQATVAEQHSSSGEDVFDTNVKGVLELTCDFGNVGAAGSGLLVDENGMVVTNAHVVVADGVPSRQIMAKIAGKYVGARIICYDEANDLAVIKLDSVSRDAKVLKFGDFGKVKTGQRVYVIGNSLGDGTCITSGIVSDKCRLVGNKMLMMTDCAINGGNSGGPIFNESGEVIGVIVSGRLNSDGTDAQGMKYAIPCSTVQRFIGGTKEALKQMAGQFELPPKQYTTCPKCGKTAQKFPNGRVGCSNCGYGLFGSRAEQKIVCPKCGSTTCDQINGIRYCYDCDHEW